MRPPLCRRLTLALILLLLAACGGEAAIPTTVPPATVALISPTLVPEPTADAVTTSTQVPTSTDEPVVAPTTAPTAAPIAAQAPTPAATVESVVVPTPVPTSMPEPAETLVPAPSPAPTAATDSTPTEVLAPTPIPTPDLTHSEPPSSESGSSELQACLTEVLSVETVLRLAAGESPSMSELMEMTPCLLAFGDSDEEGGQDGGTITSARATVDGQLTNVQMPTPVSAPADNTGCQEFESGDCAELRWELLSGLQSGEATRIRIAPSDPNVIYAVFDANDMSAWKSTDAGVTWRRVAHNAHTSDLVVHPTNPDIAIYSVLENNLYGTFDGGRSWRAVLTAAAGFQRGAAQFNALAQSTSSPGVVYAAVGGEERGIVGAPVPQRFIAVLILEVAGRRPGKGRNWVRCIP